MLRSAIIAASRSRKCRSLVENLPLARPIVDRFVAGEGVTDALAATRELTRDRLVTLDHLGEDTGERAQADAAVEAYQSLLGTLADEGLAAKAEVSVKLSALGRTLPRDGDKIALEGARAICEAAASAGTTVTVDMEDHTTVDATLSIVRELRVDFPWVGAVVQAYLRRTEGDCADLAGPGSRVRLCKGAYDEPASVAYRDRADVDASYVRCLKTLMHGDGYPMVATHDPRLIEIAQDLALRAGRGTTEYEHQMLFGIRVDEQRRLAARGLGMRVYVPYGGEWYPYFVRRLGERPANLAFFARALVGR
ncbi:proline dehydrogenase [Prauserella sp. PE36]|uniref:proline dehydrogenase n=1 Tax=Prauserella endophytica TaxID=1592324 RepID=A0ABY2RXK8_9PSEU|nr:MULTISPECIES: proline dehydrogenase family protein [Prauserella]PXY34464.1 proline dehydrogenase [Prauserella coralliicola]RBM13071.1 proline dehydrogenase [Prauserella sp. PE36]TKG62861.1 proline dehydrogenase [Prauserella endophytica]